MAKEVTFELTIRFSEKVTSDDDFKQISENICNAIYREAKEYGISPDDSDMYVEWVGVSHPLSETRVIKKLV
jgi:hypothetical protein